MKANKQKFKEYALQEIGKYAVSVDEESVHIESLAKVKTVSHLLYLMCMLLIGAMGTAIGKASGILIAAPTLPALAFFWLGKRFLGENRKPWLPLLSILFAHSIWMLLSGFLLTGEGFHLSYSLEALLYFSAVVWLAMKPGRLPLIVLSIYTAVALVAGLASFNTPGLSLQGLLLQIGLRIFILLMMAPLLFNKWARRLSSGHAEGEEAPQDSDLAALTKEKQELLKKKAYLDLQAEVERLREDVGAKAKKP